MVVGGADFPGDREGWAAGFFTIAHSNQVPKPAFQIGLGLNNYTALLVNYS
jgi:hypothetical protein